MPVNGFHGRRVAHDFQGFDDGLHSIRRKDVGDRFIVPRNGNRLLLGLFEQAGEIGLASRHTIRIFHVNIRITQD